MAIPAAGASAATLWVSNSAAVSSPGNSCTHPGYKTIQSALAASGATVEVCTGTYTEQLTITKTVKLVAVNGAGTAKVVLPGSPVVSTTPCDEASLKGLKKLEVKEGNPESDAQPDEDAVSICTGGTVTVTGLTFEPKWPGNTCDDSLYGILVGGGATLKATNVTVDGGGAYPINGCQGGVSIQAGMAWASPVEPGHVTLSEDTVTEYQKNGITTDGAGSSAKISHTTVVGAGATPETAQNGIQVSNGARATISSSSISGNECDNSGCGSDAFEKYQATGVLFYGAASGSKVTGTALKENDIGVYLDSESPTQPTSPELTIEKDVFSGNRYEGVALDKGDASLKNDTITGPGNIGIDLFQYEQQPYAPTSSASHDEIDGMSEAAVKVESDKAPGDHAGSFTLSGSTLSGNAQAVVDESTTFNVVL
ncbi:MAG: right-handed parallel beta-helix repeat-containing protein [Solirubrobacteraceae bacterium]